MFSGIAMFGFWGIVIGPVLMIVIVTTISVYLAVYKGVPLEQHDEDDKPKRTVAASGASPPGRQPTNRSLKNSTTRLRAS